MLKMFLELLLFQCYYKFNTKPYNGLSARTSSTIPPINEIFNNVYKP